MRYIKRIEYAELGYIIMTIECKNRIIYLKVSADRIGHCVRYGTPS